MLRTYSELIQIPTFRQRYEYLRLGSIVGEKTFGFDRYVNQKFYHSAEWKRVRRDVIIRDNGCDMAMPGYDLHGNIYIHHINPMTIDDITNREEWILNPEYLVCVSYDTHNAIHFGDESQLNDLPPPRTENDMAPWLNAPKNPSGWQIPEEWL